MNVGQLLFIIILLATGFFASSWSEQTPSSEPTSTQLSSKTQTYDFSVPFGNPETAVLTVIMYHSLNCIHCKEYLEDVFPKIKEKYITTGQVYFEIRDFPIDQAALDAARLAWCRKDPQVYWEIASLLHNQLIPTEQTPSWAQSSHWCEDLTKLLIAQGFSEEECHNCLNDEQLKKKIIEESFKVQQKHHLTYTPAFIIDGKLHKDILSLEDLEKALQEKLYPKEGTSVSAKEHNAG
jgi:protein-disulfide isomerase